jgi:hypothetical protein
VANKIFRIFVGDRTTVGHYGGGRGRRRPSGRPRASPAAPGKVRPFSGRGAPMGAPKAGGHAGPPLQIVVFQWETDIKPRGKLKEAGDPDASFPGGIHHKAPRLPRTTEPDSLPEGIAGPPSGTFHGPPSLPRRRSRHLLPRPAISARPALGKTLDRRPALAQGQSRWP